MNKTNATSSIERITPEKAKIYLENVMDGQRKVRETFVARLAEEMRMGRFRLSSDAVTFFNGKLGNGRHRLLAVIQSGLSQLFIVYRTSDEKVFEILDCGITRSVADVLLHEGFDYPKDKAAMATMVVYYDKGLLTRFGSNSRLEQVDEKNEKYWKTWTRGEVIEYAKTHRNSLDKIAPFISNLYRQYKILARALAGALIEIADRKYPGKGEEFIEKTYTGGPADDAAFDMRQKLIKESINKGKGRPLPRPYIFGLLIKSFMLYIAGKRTGVLKIAEGEDYPTIS